MRLKIAPAELQPGDLLHRVEGLLLTGWVTAAPTRDGVLWRVPAPHRSLLFAPAAQITITRSDLAGGAR